MRAYVCTEIKSRPTQTYPHVANGSSPPPLPIMALSYEGDNTVYCIQYNVKSLYRVAEDRYCISRWTDPPLPSKVSSLKMIYIISDIVNTKDKKKKKLKLFFPSYEIAQKINYCNKPEYLCYFISNFWCHCCIQYTEHAVYFIQYIQNIVHSIQYLLHQYKFNRNAWKEEE